MQAANFAAVMSQWSALKTAASAKIDVKTTAAMLKR
jgi:hypothetical protein